MIAACLAHSFREVRGVEIMPRLCESATEAVEQLRRLQDDGTLEGWGLRQGSMTAAERVSVECKDFLQCDYRCSPEPASCSHPCSSLAAHTVLSDVDILFVASTSFDAEV